jgi:hypothetical protein
MYVNTFLREIYFERGAIDNDKYFLQKYRIQFITRRYALVCHDSYILRGQPFGLRYTEP